MNYKRKRPRTKSSGSPGQMTITPAWWNILFNGRPKRRRDKRHEREVVKGVDPDEVVWDLGNSKPHAYYW